LALINEEFEQLDRHMSENQRVVVVVVVVMIMMKMMMVVAAAAAKCNFRREDIKE
jgi:hypothetical protein